MVGNCIFKLTDVTKEYKMGEITVQAIKPLSFEILSGELVVVLGPSGSGKSTLLNIMGGMDIPTSGNVLFNGIDISRYNETKLTYFRREKIGFVFQFYNLMPNLTARENIEISTEISKNPINIDDVLERVGLKERSNHFPSQLSGGEQQRVSIARAIAKNPDVLLCDEPTGALDYITGKKILMLLKKINEESGKTIILITHNQPIADIAHRVIKMRSGSIVDIKLNENPINPELIEW